MHVPNFQESLLSLSGVGPRVFQLLKKLQLTTLQDLLFHLPSRYQNRSRITPIHSLKEGDWALIEGEIKSVSFTKGKRTSLLCQLKDLTGSIQLRFFYFTAQQKNQLSIGAKLRCFGEIRRSFGSYGFEMIHPEYRHFGEFEQLPIEQSLTPIYPATEGLSQTLLRRLTAQALEQLKKHPQSFLELLPNTLLSRFHLSAVSDALWFVHRPPVDANVDLLLSGQHPAQRRLIFEELLAHQVSLTYSRLQSHGIQAIPLASDDAVRKKFLTHLSFELTAAQNKVIAEIDQDLNRPYPMLRLLQGDVGAGKTVVAAMAILNAVSQNTQAVLTAPTEILAEQHFQLFTRWFEPLGIQVCCLTGKHKSAVRKHILQEIADGQAQVIIGTHALFQEKVNYHRLALIVVDEQQRFGVNQRLALRAKGANNNFLPHQLIMSATPIPRTLAMAAYSDLDISTIDQLPPGRKPIVTVLISDQKRPQVIERVRLACRDKKQIYWVCTLIEDSEILQCRAAEQTTKELQQLLPELSIGLVHSRLAAEQKSELMTAFKQGEIDLLVATTVIEVGVDVPNASLMIIENPERLGLSQLHQLRGRIGRGDRESFCVLLYQEPLSAIARQRLQIIRDTQNGFIIAQEDLAIRGPGEVLGTRQSGILRYRLADLQRDHDLLPQVQQAAEWVVHENPQLINPLIFRWARAADQFIQV